MNFNIDNSQYPILEVNLDNGELIKLESGAMLSKTSGIKLEGKMNGGGVFKAMAKSMVGGENFFTTTATSMENNQHILLAPKGFGVIYNIQITDTQWYLEDGVFLAASAGIEYNVVRQQGLGNALFGGTGGFFILKTSGQGNLFIEAFGSIKEIILQPGQEYIVDNSHLVAWEETVHHSIEVASGVLGYKTGEGLVTRLRGQGKILIQTRHPESFAQKIIPFVPRQR